MLNFINNQQRLDDVIFKGRNQAYGAYAIRSSYGQTVFKSLSIVAFGFGSIMSVAFYLSNRGNNEPSEQSIVPVQDSLINIIYELKKEEPEAPAEATRHKPAAASSDRAVSNQVNVVDTLPAETHTVLSQSEPVQQLAATSASGAALPDPGNSTGGGGDKTSGGGHSETEVNDLYRVDAEPQFKGGLKELLRFVGLNLRYPREAADAGKGGTVYVKFVVDERGKVGWVTLQNHLGYGMDEEARRVVGLIPDFVSPALVQGKPVKVYYQLPIKFSAR